MKHFIIILFLVIPVALSAQVKKIAILETVDKSGTISYVHKLMLRSNLAKAIAKAPGYEAYDRTDMDAIMGEQNFQRTGMVSEDQIKRLGEMTGAQYILVAEAAKVDDNNMFITAKILNVETAKTEISDNVLMSTTPSDIQNGCESLANKLLGINVSKSASNQTVTSNFGNQNQQVVSQMSIPSNNVSNEIGTVVAFPDNTKGIIFMKNADGTGLAVSLDMTTAQWQNARKNKDCQNIAQIPDTDGENMCRIGLGMQYTTALISQLGSMATAAEWCTRHGEGWYLPSSGELAYLFSIEKQTNGLISIALQSNNGRGLADEWYWSSSENDDDEAINVSLSGRMSSEDKIETLYVRAIRAF